MFSRLIWVAPVAVLVAGCAVDPVTQSYDPSFGEANKYNNAVQTINPDPVYAADSAQPGDNGDVGAHAVKRYRTDTVKAIETMETTSGSSGGGPK
ncbi:hypothetical protein LZ016_01405 [Sphingomonas sp. SM33]|uniref:Lipoprotein n=1 Tax=Sphingomonas telluris TaxID=2907998 RepID=A0ABS9VIJ3_9SPHN|nr:hypothetical protein [Sphingomonas telluris]MCH8614765.1 hypothetical protein [Sphingomonas telluris]